MQNFNTTAAIQAAIAKGAFDPHIRLTNMAMAYYQSMENRPAKSLFPVLPVQLSTSSYYKFSKEDLLRDNVQRKPQFGKVNPAQIAYETGVYSCQVDQIILGIDQIMQVDYRRTKAPAFIQAENAKTKTITQQMAIHQDIVFAESFFKSNVWGNEWRGAAAADESNKKFVKFSDANSTPIQFFRARVKDIQQQTGRKPNKLGLGVDTFEALINHPTIIARVEGMGSSENPAQANESVLAKLFGVEKVVVFDTIANFSKPGLDGRMDFICDRKGALLVYAPDTPSIDEPSAGYIFTWDMLGDGNYLPILKGLGEFGTHSEYIEGLIANDMRKTADDLGCYMSECV